MKTRLLLYLVLAYPAFAQLNPGSSEFNQKGNEVMLSFVNSENTKILNSPEAVENLKKALTSGEIKIASKNFQVTSVLDWREFLLTEIHNFAGEKTLVLPRNFYALDECSQKILLSALVLTHGYLSGLDSKQLELLAAFALPEAQELEITSGEAKELLDSVSGFEEFALKNYESVINVALKNCVAMDLDRALAIRTRDKEDIAAIAEKTIKKHLQYLKEQIKR